MHTSFDPQTVIRPCVNHARRDVLCLMMKLDDREGAVLAFMQTEFGTKVVADLNDSQLYRVSRYVEVVLNVERCT